MGKGFSSWGWESILEIKVIAYLKVNLKNQRFISHVKRFKIQLWMSQSSDYLINPVFLGEIGSGSPWIGRNRI